MSWIPNSNIFLKKFFGWEGLRYEVPVCTKAIKYGGKLLS